jgi:hypothetical protein
MLIINKIHNKNKTNQIYLYSPKYTFGVFFAILYM